MAALAQRHPGTKAHHATPSLRPGTTWEESPARKAVRDLGFCLGGEIEIDDQDMELHHITPCFFGDFNGYGEIWNFSHDISPFQWDFFGGFHEIEIYDQDMELHGITPFFLDFNGFLMCYSMDINRWEWG